MTSIKSRTIQSGDQVALLLPAELGFAADLAVTIERHGDVLTIRPATTAVVQSHELLALIDGLEGVAPTAGIDEDIDFSGYGRS